MSQTEDRSNEPRHARDEDLPTAEHLEAETTDPEENKNDQPMTDQSKGAASADADVENYDAQKAVLADDSFDYIVPQESYKKHSSRRRVSRHSGNTRTATKEELEAADEGYVFTAVEKHGRKRHRHRKHWFRYQPRWKKVLIVVTSVILAMVIAFGGTFLILREIGRRSIHHYDDFAVTTPSADEKGNEIIKADNSGRVITYNGMSYQLNENLINIVFIGVDEGSEENAGLQMADAIYTLAFDTKTGSVKVLSISRDTMADVDLYSEQGKYIDTERMQLAFSHAYKGEGVTGGRNTTISISRLFYGLPLENYFAINMDALITLNDTIGGVTLTSSMTFTSPVDGRIINEGETVTLHGKEADAYVRSRETSKLDSNNARMARQQEYIRAFMSAIVPAVKKDPSVVTKLYSDITSNSETSLDLAEITYIASAVAAKLRSASDIEYVSLKGEITEGEFAEMKVTNEEALKTMLGVFYTPLAKVPDGIKQ